MPCQIYYRSANWWGRSNERYELVTYFPVAPDRISNHLVWNSWIHGTHILPKEKSLKKIPFSLSSLHPSREQIQVSPNCELQVVTSRTLPVGRRVRKEELETILSLLQADMQMQINWLIAIQNVQHPFKRTIRLCLCLSASPQDLPVFLPMNAVVQVWSVQTVPHRWLWKLHSFCVEEKLANWASCLKLQIKQEWRKRSLSFTSALCRQVCWAEVWSCGWNIWEWKWLRTKDGWGQQIQRCIFKSENVTWAIQSINDITLRWLGWGNDYAHGEENRWGLLSLTDCSIMQSLYSSKIGQIQQRNKLGRRNCPLAPCPSCDGFPITAN